jgi:hypothetical protein
MADLTTSAVIDALMQATTTAEARAALEVVASAPAAGTFKPPGLTDCTGALTLVTVGDSITSGSDNWPGMLITKSSFAGRGATLVNVATAGAGTSGDVAQVATHIAPYAPGPGDVLIVTYCKGTNDGIVAGVGEGVTTYNTFVGIFEDWCDAVYALNAGGTIIIIAMTTTDRFDVAGGEEFDTFRTLQNGYFRKNEGTKFDYLYDRALVFHDNTDSFWFADQLHHTTAGKQRIAYDLNKLLITGGMINYPPASEGVIIGTAGSNVPSNTLLTTTPRAFTAAQVFTEQLLTDGATVNWNLDTQQIARVVLGGNRAIANPTNMKAGGLYELTIEQDAIGSRAPTWGDAYVGLPTLSSAAYRRHAMLFRCYGTDKMLCVANNSYDATPPIEPGEGDMVIESFADVAAAGRALVGAAPNVLNTPGGVWVDGGGSGTVNVPAGNPGYGSNTNVTPIVYKETGESDVTIECLMRYTSNSSAGVQGIILRYTDSNNYWIFGANGSSGGLGITIWKKEAGGYTNYDYANTYNDTNGVMLKVVASSTDIKFYVDDVLKRTDTNAFNRTATKHGIGGINLGANIARWWGPLTISNP